MKAYIEAEDGQAADLNFYVAQQGFRELGFECVLFESLDEIELDADWPVVGYGGTILRAVERLGCQRPAPLGFPSSLGPLAGRKLWRTTTKELLQAASYPVFIKPLLREKAFAGLVVQNQQEASRAVGHLEEPMELLASEVVNFVSEYRVFVLRGKAIGCRHYKGDFRVFPALEVADRAIALYEEAPL